MGERSLEGRGVFWNYSESCPCACSIFPEYKNLLCILVKTPKHCFYRQSYPQNQEQELKLNWSLFWNTTVSVSPIHVSCSCYKSLAKFTVLFGLLYRTSPKAVVALNILEKKTFLTERFFFFMSLKWQIFFFFFTVFWNSLCTLISVFFPGHLHSIPLLVSAVKYLFFGSQGICALPLAFLLQTVSDRFPTLTARREKNKQTNKHPPSPLPTPPLPLALL